MTEQTDVQIGTNIAELRGARSQGWVAEQMRARGHRWAQTTVSSVERGAQALRARELLDLAAVLAPTMPLKDVVTDGILGRAAEFQHVSDALAGLQLLAVEETLDSTISEIRERRDSIRAIRLTVAPDDTPSA